LKIWFSEIGEPLPLEKDVRLHRVGNLSRILADAGHEVIWWTSSFSHAPKRIVCDPGDYAPFPGVRLRVLPGLGYRRNVSVARFRHQADFARRLKFAMERESPPDIMLTGVPTLETADVAVQHALSCRFPILVDIRDEWPDEFVRLAPRPARWAARLALNPLFAKMHRIGRGATGIVGISRRQMTYGLGFSERAEGPFDGVFPLGYSASRPSAEKIAEARRFWIQLGVRPEAFVVCFFGTLGPFFTIEPLIAAMRQLQGKVDAQLVVCGDGSHLDFLKSKAMGLTNVFFPGWVGGPQIAALMEMSAVGVAPYASDAPAFSLPNKPFEYMAGGLPVLSSIRGELRPILEESGCGLSYDADDASGFATLVEHLNNQPEERRLMGERGRQLLEREYRVESIASRLEKHMKMVVASFLDRGLKKE
jgi:glycosyltransferase involved in cell wall biosynthesis